MDQFTEEKTTEHVPYIRCDNLVRIYKSEEIEVMALQGLDLEVEKGELMAIIGKSGSGKSTLLGLLGAMDRPSVGGVYYDGVCLNDLSNKQLAKFRNDHIGFVWQKNSDNLLFSNEPELLLMDEPTGAVDRKTSIMLQDMFRDINRKLGITIIIVTHDIGLADRVDRVVMISDGKISSERILKEQYEKAIEAGENFVEGAAWGSGDANGEQMGFNPNDSHEEFSILDKAGRVKLSDEMRKAAGINSNRVKIDIEDGKIVITSEDK